MTTVPENAHPVGKIISADLTIPNTDAIRDFYQQVIGWEVENMPMEADGEAYNDYVMKDKDGNWIGGVCHARGVNLGLPPQWLIYVNVEDIAASIAQCVQLGGKALKEARAEDGTLMYAVIQDPGGAVMGLTKTG